jgi:hypothetical protein
MFVLPEDNVSLSLVAAWTLPSELIEHGHTGPYYTNIRHAAFRHEFLQMRIS